MRGLGCLLILASLGGITLGVRSLITASRSTAQPVHIKAADLTRDQAAINPHVIIDGIFPCSFDAIIGKSHGDKFAWMPAITATPEFASALQEWRARQAPLEKFPRQPDVRLLIKTSDTSDDHVLSLTSKTSLQGMLVENDLGMIKSIAMQRNYPGLAANNCLVLHEGAKPPGSLESLGSFGLAAALLIGGLVLLFLPRSSPRGSMAGPAPTIRPPITPQ